MSALIRACVSDHSPAGIRDAAIIALAWPTGLRLDEISRIPLTDPINQTDDSMDIRIHGKGDKVRIVDINNGALAAILDWLALRGDEPGALFTNVNKGGRITGGRLCVCCMCLIRARRLEKDLTML